MKRHDNPFENITMQDIRLLTGEGKLTNQSILQAVNAIIEQRKYRYQGKLTQLHQELARVTNDIRELAIE